MECDPTQMLPNLLVEMILFVATHASNVNAAIVLEHDYRMENVIHLYLKGSGFITRY